METRPQELEKYGTIMSNFDHEIEKGAEENLKSNNIYGDYSGWDFHGTVWFDKINKVFKCQVMQYRSHMATIEGDNLSDIMKEVSDRFGYK